MSCLPTEMSGVAIPISWQDRPSMTVPREFDGFPPSKSLSHTFLKITSLIPSADDAFNPPPRLIPVSSCNQCRFSFRQVELPTKRFPTRKTKAREA